MRNNKTWNHKTRGHVVVHLDYDALPAVSPLRQGFVIVARGGGPPRLGLQSLAQIANTRFDRGDLGMPRGGDVTSEKQHAKPQQGVIWSGLTEVLASNGCGVLTSWLDGWADRAGVPAVEVGGKKGIKSPIISSPPPALAGATGGSFSVGRTIAGAGGSMGGWVGRWDGKYHYFRIALSRACPRAGCWGQMGPRALCNSPVGVCVRVCACVLGVILRACRFIEGICVTVGGSE